MFPFFNHYPGTDLHEIDLAYILKIVPVLEQNTNDLIGWRAEHEAEYQELKSLYDDLLAGNYTDEMKQAFSNWMRINAADLIGSMVDMVFFGLTESGYFVAYIPESWDDIIFNTTGLDISVPTEPEYGHLVLSY